MNQSTTRYPHRQAPPAGFTLIELLMVIIIVGILAGILLMALGRGSTAARNTRVVTEINQLQTAAETYRTERGSYPITLGRMPGEPQDSRVQPDRVMRHVAKAFPRFTGNYEELREQIAIATKPIVPFYEITPVHLYSSSNTAADGGLDIANLDPAEALVFWLGGIPDPTSETKVAGFRLDPASPFFDPNNIGAAPSDLTQQRSRPFFPFDPRRLVDYDEDGFFEYLPPGGSFEQNTPPYVYFDSGSYLLAPAYPLEPSDVAALLGTLGDPPVPPAIVPTGYISQWGMIYPYQADPPGGTIRYVNSNTFQIIAAGVDGRYGPPTLPAIQAGPPPFWAPPRYFPSTQGFAEDDLDNLTNFARGPLQDEAPAP